MLRNILSGWKNFLHKTEVTEAVAARRATICAACPHAKEGKLLTFIKDRLKEIEGAYCTACGCPLSAKVRSNDICPKHKW
jgi:TPP-dependent indolepyruvate ferredoxin oxidoreductase alpha subunit